MQARSRVRPLPLTRLQCPIGIIISLTGNSCGIEYILIINDISSYEQSLDPEFCEIIVYRIDLFNDDCEPQIEILDCG